ncbi:MAG TPA: choice-of-anchor U domain-containing protein [Nitrososphaerales archaeon]|nr:choice-of-anchor U domain-containing protein [Nitrososphaerales archaeon]
MISVVSAAAPAHAATETISDETSCESMGGTWTFAHEYYTCSVASLSVAEGETLYVGESGGLPIALVVQSGGDLSVYGELDNNYVSTPGFPPVYPSFVIYGTLDNYGVVQTGGFFYNYGTINNWNNWDSDSSYFNNYGTINNYGLFEYDYYVLTNEPNGVINNQPDPSNTYCSSECATLDLGGPFQVNNFGSINNIGSSTFMGGAGAFNDECGGSLNDSPTANDEVTSPGTQCPSSTFSASTGGSVTMVTPDATIAVASSSDGPSGGISASICSPGCGAPFGYYTFTIGDLTEGNTIAVVLTFPSAVPAGYTYLKFDSIGDQYDATGLTSASGDVLTIIITDGQAPGDLDGSVNGMITDPGAPVIPGGSGGSGGSSTGVPQFPSSTMLLVTIAVATAVLLAMRGRFVGSTTLQGSTQAKGSR